ncbi:arsenate reductase (glutaredoxin) [Thiothrix eikelboomii]|uniref:arsenate reductase (glutaredoxin) n=1 Tax=Thiothrix eikelboomii TaxID=92487 RepID=UPI003BB066F4
MDNTVTIYHNPRCSKSKQALALLEEEGVSPDIINYLNNPLSADKLRELLGMLGMSARGLLRKTEAEYAELKLADTSLSDEQLIQAMVKHPKLIERPIVVVGGKAVIGRPPEKVLDLI